MKLGRAPTMWRIFIATNDTGLLCHELHEFALTYSFIAMNYMNLHRLLSFSCQFVKPVPAVWGFVAQILLHHPLVLE